MGFRASWLPYLGLPLNGGPGVHRRVWCTSRGTATTLSGGGSPGLPYPRASLRYEEKKEGKKEEEEVRRRRPLEEARWGALAPRLKLSRKGLGRPGKSWPASERGWAGRPAEQDARDQPPLKEKIVCVPGGWVGAREHEGCYALHEVLIITTPCLLEAGSHASSVESWLESVTRDREGSRPLGPWGH